jgi:hypothetical protein
MKVLFGSKEMQMNCFRRFVAPVATMVLVFAAIPSRADAGKTYSCKSDRVVDVPVQFVVQNQSAVRVHVSAYGGSDKSGLVYPAGWTLYDGSGRKVDTFPKAPVVWTSTNMLKEANLEGLVPGSTYTIALTSQDWCGNVAAVKRTVTMPGIAPEAVAPDLSAPSTVQSGLMGYQFTQLAFDVTENTGLQNVTVSIDGTVVESFTYGDGVNFRWWFDDYPFDSTKSTLEGPCYYVTYPDSYRNQWHLVEVVAVDVYGNTSVTSATLLL